MTKTFCLLVFSVAWLVIVVPLAQAFSEADIQGPYGFSFLGTAGSNPASAVGRFDADGQGNFRNGERTLIVNGVASEQTFTCTYSVSDNGKGNATCTVTPPVIGTETFNFVLPENAAKADFVATTPGVTIRGTATKQTSTKEREE